MSFVLIHLPRSKGEEYKRVALPWHCWLSRLKLAELLSYRVQTPAKGGWSRKIPNSALFLSPSTRPFYIQHHYCFSVEYRLIIKTLLYKLFKINNLRLLKWWSWRLNCPIQPPLPADPKCSRPSDRPLFLLRNWSSSGRWTHYRWCRRYSLYGKLVAVGPDCALLFRIHGPVILQVLFVDQPGIFVHGASNEGSSHRANRPAE